MEKFKDAHPVKTVENIKEILRSVGIKTTEVHSSSGISSCYSLRVNIEDTQIGQNGKGTALDFAAASAYAELMERIQNDYFFAYGYDEETHEAKGFHYTPDEVNDEIPFYSIKNKKLVYMPVFRLRKLHLTNGTCAGNTPYEALVQGLSEILERHSILRHVKEKIIPFSIPDDDIKKFPRLYSMVEEIRSKSGVDLILKDCSLDLGFPVIASILIKDSKYVIKFGAHPDFEIAAERTLTEIFQGRSLSGLAGVDPFEQISVDYSSPVNIHNIMKNSSGHFPPEFFIEKKAVDRKSFPDVTDLTNRELFLHILGIFKKLDLDVLVRNNSFLGFPGFQVIVPGFSEIFTDEKARSREEKSLMRARNTIRNTSKASVDDISSLTRYLKYKSNWALENNMEFTLGIPKTEYDMTLPFHFLLAMCYYRLGDFANSMNLARSIGIFAKDPLFMQIAVYMDMKIRGYDHESIIKYLAKIFPSGEYADLIDGFKNQEKVLENLFQDYKCYDCTSCQINCGYTKIRDIKLKLKEKQMDNPINQETFFKALLDKESLE